MESLYKTHRKNTDLNFILNTKITQFTYNQMIWPFVQLSEWIYVLINLSLQGYMIN